MLASDGLQRIKDRAAKDSPRRKVKKSRTTKAIMWAILLWVVFVCGSQEWKLYQIKQDKARIEEQIQIYEAKSELLRQQITYLSSPDYIERAAREQLGFVKDGEVPYITKPKATDPASTPAKGK